MAWSLQASGTGGSFTALKQTNLSACQNLQYSIIQGFSKIPVWLSLYLTELVVTSKSPLLHTFSRSYKFSGAKPWRRTLQASLIERSQMQGWMRSGRSYKRRVDGWWIMNGCHKANNTCYSLNILIVKLCKTGRTGFVTLDERDLLSAVELRWPLEVPLEERSQLLHRETLMLCRQQEQLLPLGGMATGKTTKWNSIQTLVLFFFWALSLQTFMYHLMRIYTHTIYTCNCW